MQCVSGAIAGGATPPTYGVVNCTAGMLYDDVYSDVCKPANQVTCNCAVEVDSSDDEPPSRIRQKKLRLKGAVSPLKTIYAMDGPSTTEEDGSQTSPTAGNSANRWKKQVHVPQGSKKRSSKRRSEAKRFARKYRKSANKSKDGSGSSEDKDFEVSIRIPSNRRDGKRDKRIQAKFEYQDGKCIQDGSNIINVPYTSNTELKECAQMCLRENECLGITYFTADVAPFKRDGDTVRSKAAGDCLLFSSVSGAVDCDEEYIGKYELYFRDDDMMVAMA